MCTGPNNQFDVSFCSKILVLILEGEYECFDYCMLLAKFKQMMTRFVFVFVSCRHWFLRLPAVSPKVSTTVFLVIIVNYG